MPEPTNQRPNNQSQPSHQSQPSALPTPSHKLSFESLVSRIVEKVMEGSNEAYIKGELGVWCEHNVRQEDRDRYDHVMLRLKGIEQTITATLRMHLQQNHR